MAVGRVIRFDGVRGYGFIAPDGGGDDVFMHVNDLLIAESQVHTGLRVEFDIQEGDRGPKASSIQLAADEPAASPGRAAPVAPGDEGPLCEVLSGDEFSTDLTEVLLRRVPSLTGEQLLQIRAAMMDFGKERGWIDG